MTSPFVVVFVPLCYCLLYLCLPACLPQQMGQLFSQMSSLVLAQAETIQRIEDDVEAGLEDTAEAHTDLVYVHELTKGNRGMIVKIFGLLVFFIMLFMVWT